MTTTERAPAYAGHQAHACPVCLNVHGGDEHAEQPAPSRIGYLWDCPNCGERIETFTKPPTLGAAGVPLREALAHWRRQADLADGATADTFRHCADEVEQALTATPALASLDVDGIVAELIGVEAWLDNARERLVKANNTLAGIARAAATEPTE